MKRKDVILVLCLGLVFILIFNFANSFTGFSIFPDGGGPDTPGDPGEEADDDLTGEDTSEENNVVVDDCNDDCSVGGEKLCEGTGYKTCGNYDDDSCLEWEVVVSCGTGKNCLEGNCFKLCTESDWSASVSPTECPSSGQQTKTWQKIGLCQQGMSHVTETTSCDYTAPICLYNYSDFGACQSTGIEVRTISSSSPVNCEGIPGLSQQCDYISPCIEANWDSSLSPIECPSPGQQTKTWQKIGTCSGGVSHITETTSCDYTAPTCNSFTYSGWSECSLSGVQERSILSSSPVNCVEGNPLISNTCEPKICVPDQIKQCDQIDNGFFTGYKDKCNSAGTNWLVENVCELGCNEGYEVRGGRCLTPEVIVNYEPELQVDEVVVVKKEEENIIKDKEEEKVLISIQIEDDLVDDSVVDEPTVDDPVADDPEPEEIDVEEFGELEITRPEVESSRGFLIVNDLILEGNTKTLYLEKRNSSSNGVCFADKQNLGDIEDILSDCVKLKCPGSFENYECEVENSTFAISGLIYSGIIEDYLYCGDDSCTGSESCSDCFQDCGDCPIIGDPGDNGDDFIVDDEEDSSFFNFWGGDDEEADEKDSSKKNSIKGILSWGTSEEGGFFSKYKLFIFLAIGLGILFLIILIIFLVKRNKSPGVDLGRVPPQNIERPALRPNMVPVKKKLFRN